jgi:hypothetical protein
MVEIPILKKDHDPFVALNPVVVFVMIVVVGSVRVGV